MSIADVPWLPLALALIYLAAAACIYRILMTYRVAQGAIAWILALIGLPYVAVPMFLLFGRNRFGGYIRARRTGDAALTELLNHFEQQTAAVSKRDDEHVPDELQVLCRYQEYKKNPQNHGVIQRNGPLTLTGCLPARALSGLTWFNQNARRRGGCERCRGPDLDHPFIQITKTKVVRRRWKGH